MKIKRTSPLSGAVNVREINVTDAQLAAWENGTLAQDAFPDLSADDREFIMTGITPEEWEETFAEPEPINPEGDSGPNYLPDPDLDS